MRKSKIALEKKVSEQQGSNDKCDACDESEKVIRDVSPTHLHILKMLFCVSVLLIKQGDPQVQLMPKFCIFLNFFWIENVVHTHL